MLLYAGFAIYFRVLICHTAEVLKLGIMKNWNLDGKKSCGVLLKVIS